MTEPPDPAESSFRHGQHVRHEPDDHAPLLGAPQIYALVKHGVFLAIAAAVIYQFWPTLLDVVSTAPRLSTLRPEWLVVMLVVEVLSFVCSWWLMRLVLPKTSWLVLATSQLVSNAVSRTVPGGAAIGGATLYRMLAVGGTPPAQAAGALAVTSIISTTALFAIPVTALLMALVGSPIPEDLGPIAAAGAVLFVLLSSFGFVGVRFDRPLVAVGSAIGEVSRRLPRRWRRDVSGGPLLAERDRLVELIGRRWVQAIGAASLNWAFDYLALVAALHAVGANPRLSLVLLAYAGAIVMSMVPITPGGFGFVEATLLSLLVLSGISAQNAGLATLAYRMVSLLLPVCCALPAWLIYQHRFRSTEPGPGESPQGSGSSSEEAS